MSRGNRIAECRNNDPRSHETRSDNTRVDETRAEDINFTSPDSFNLDAYDPATVHKIRIPVGVERPGYHYNIGRYTVRGEEDFQRHELKMAKQYNIVEPSRATYRKKNRTNGQDLSAAHHLSIGDCIVYERNDAFKEKDDAFNENESLKAIRSCKGVQDTKHIKNNTHYHMMREY